MTGDNDSGYQLWLNNVTKRRGYLDLTWSHRPVARPSGRWGLKLKPASQFAVAPPLPDLVSRWRPCRPSLRTASVPVRHFSGNRDNVLWDRWPHICCHLTLVNMSGSCSFFVRGFRVLFTLYFVSVKKHRSTNVVYLEFHCNWVVFVTENLFLFLTPPGPLHTLNLTFDVQEIIIFISI